MYVLASYITCVDVEINAFFPNLVALIINIIKIGTPILLIILGMIDMFKAMTAQKEDEIKKAQGLFIKRLVAGILVYLVFVIVDVVLSVLSGVGEDQVGAKDNWACVECFIKGTGTDTCPVVEK